MDGHKKLKYFFDEVFNKREPTLMSMRDFRIGRYSQNNDDKIFIKHKSWKKGKEFDKKCC